MELPLSIAVPISAPTEQTGMVKDKDLSIIMHDVDASDNNINVLSPAV